MRLNRILMVLGSGIIGFGLIIQSAAAKDVYHIKNEKSGFCLDGFAFGKEIKASACRRHFDAQKWTLIRKTREIKHSGQNHCLNISVSDMNNGAKIVLWPCNGGKNQQWVIERSGAVRSLLNNKCIDLSRQYSGEKSAAVKMWDCNNKANQKWSAIDVGVK